MAENTKKIRKHQPPKTSGKKGASARANHRPIEFGGPLGDLVEIYGTAERVAELIGTSARSLRRWAQGKGFPNIPAGKMLVVVAAKHGITAEQLRPILEGRGSVYPADFDF